MEKFIERKREVNYGKKRRSIALKQSAAPNYQELMMNGSKILLPAGISPYPTQKLMMIKVLMALRQETNALIESPTGSGKTLALLASTGAWLVDYQRKRKEQRKLCPKHGLQLDIKEDSPISPATKKNKKNESSLSIKDEKNGIKVEGESDPIYLNESTMDQISSAFNEEPRSASDSMNESSFPMFGGPSQEELDEEEEKKDGCTCLPCVRIYYCTRTHKQIAQVVKEYARLPYAYTGLLKHTILASRNQTCVNAEIRNKPGDINKNCRDLIKEGKKGNSGCDWRDPLSKKYERKGSLRFELENRLSLAWDIEEITQELASGKGKMCPYFATTRYLTPDADLIFCPFNYLLDPIIRNSSDVHPKNSIIILDEAHNIEDVCRDSASFQFNETELVAAMADFKHKMAKLQTEKEFYQATLNRDKEDPSTEFLITLDHSMVNMSEFLKWFYQIFTDLTHKAKSGNQMYPISFNLDWAKTFELFKRIAEPGFPEEIKAWMKSFVAITGKGSESPSITVEVSQILPASATVVCVEKILYFLYFYGKDNNRMYYKSNLRIEPSRGRYDFNSQIMPPETTINYLVPGCNVTLNLWCMLPSVSVRDAFANCRSVILASGTLHPIDTFATELGMDFRFQMEGDQLIDRERIFATGLPFGPSNKALKLTYKEMENDIGIKLELAKLVFDVCQVVPKGVLCFVASYRMLDDIVTQLTTSGLMVRLQAIKDVFQEPKNSIEMQDVQEQYERCAQTPNKGKTGALMLAVFRGKVSEGIDFADDKARCVISIGIPFPNLKDEQVAQKRYFNDFNAKSMTLLPGSEWYSMQAFRALNQALGRCLRHRNDWGALILVDERFQYPQPKISKWVRERMTRYVQYGSFRESLAEFVEKHTGMEVKTEVPEVDCTPPAQRRKSLGMRKNPIFK
ncbi:unnamed protein product [Bursaphelenchus xylophilus]|uniref:DNA 5'-3' helicase n=1 Tax=Bursaphelenchus xylophilus TaxID=6326 RepID=A0A1I7RZ76_BURXY|nr:unnamed protein product [Bursaphelenchus xylophilus]CAG9106772.1 unnamed protein product [Bursaphelenchus xylophilus]